ncbi:hypothetical protein H4S14_004251 [Agrobacterium vitis]|nr:hypothetical protein [Agrobacterium vitis]MBE1440472.1 hypothetical protein [Agrobacterium vitis]
MLKDEPLLWRNKIGTDGANTFPSAIKTSVDSVLLHPDPMYYAAKHLQQGIESDHIRPKKNMPKIGGFQSFNTARRTNAISVLDICHGPLLRRITRKGKSVGIVRLNDKEVAKACRVLLSSIKR